MHHGTLLKPEWELETPSMNKSKQWTKEPGTKGRKEKQTQRQPPIPLIPTPIYVHEYMRIFDISQNYLITIEIIFTLDQVPRPEVKTTRRKRERKEK